MLLQVPGRAAWTSWAIKANAPGLVGGEFTQVRTNVLGGHQRARDGETLRGVQRLHVALEAAVAGARERGRGHGPGGGHPPLDP
jgi:hypothetical protein